MKHTTFSAAQFAAALGCSERRVRQMFASLMVPSNRVKRQSGQSPLEYSVSAIPGSVRERLEKSANERGYRDIEQLLAGAMDEKIVARVRCASIEEENFKGVTDRRLLLEAAIDCMRLRRSSGEDAKSAKCAVFKSLLRSEWGIISKSKAGLRKKIDSLWSEICCDKSTPEILENRRLGRCGRKPLAIIPEKLLPDVHKLVVQTDPNTGSRVCVSMALRLFATSDKCPENVAAAITKPRKSKHTITPTLKRQARVTAETKMKYRGNKNFALNAYSQPRSLTWIDIDGAERPILAGDIFEPDDMTLNQPWWVEWDGSGGGDPCAEKFGVRLLRGQLLMMIDVGSQRILGFLLLARAKDSYRAEDIWSWFGQVFRDVGLPRVGIRMERGIWESRAIHGIPIVDQTWNRERRLGGLSELGVRAIPSFSPHTKSIESLFNNFQKVCGCTSIQVGRKRGEFEKETKDYLACRAGRKHPADCGFLHADELAKRIANACAWLNQDCREGEVYRGIPDELWQRDVVSKAALRAVPNDKSWVFHREKRPLTLNGGMVRTRFAEHNCSYYFTNPELFASLGKGYRVIVCFDPAIPEQGAVVFNNETGPRDHLNAGAGAFLGVAEFVDRVSQYNALDQFDDRGGYERRQRFTAQCRRLYHAIALPGARAAVATLARDDRGNEVRIERNVKPPLTVRAPTEIEGRELISKAEQLAAEEEESRRMADRCNRLERQAIERGDLPMPFD